MKITEILKEASAGERKRQRKSAALQARTDQLERQQLAQQLDAKRSAARAQQIAQKIAPPAKTPPSEPTSTASAWGDAALDAYRVDPTVDTSFEGGYYLRFWPQVGNMYAYWSKGDLTFQQAAQFKQTMPMGLKFKPAAFQQLVDNLILTTGRGGQSGYVHVELPKKLLSHPYIQALYSHLLSEYPQNDPTISGNVGWEIV
jgi:hypothetical protein